MIAKDRGATARAAETAKRTRREPVLGSDPKQYAFGIKVLGSL